jgi:hypothetical protein
MDEVGRRTGLKVEAVVEFGAVPGVVRQGRLTLAESGLSHPKVRHAHG